MSYQRVIPRDLFNEASLLKCLGRLWIKLDERSDHAARLEGPAFSDEGFLVDQNPADRSIEVVNVTLLVDDEDVPLFRPLNSLDKWPLWARFGDNEFRVFDLDGDLDTDFWCQISQRELVRRRAERSQP